MPGPDRRIDEKKEIRREKRELQAHPYLEAKDAHEEDKMLAKLDRDERRHQALHAIMERDGGRSMDVDSSQFDPNTLAALNDVLAAQGMGTIGQRQS